MIFFFLVMELYTLNGRRGIHPTPVAVNLGKECLGISGLMLECVCIYSFSPFHSVNVGKTAAYGVCSGGDERHTTKIVPYGVSSYQLGKNFHSPVLSWPYSQHGCSAPQALMKS